MLQHLRDESHRFAIGFHRELRRKQVANSLLDDIPGIGKKRKMLLLNHFGSVREIRKASPADIANAVPGLGETTAYTLLEYLSKK